MFSNYNYINETHKKHTKNFTIQHIDTIKRKQRKINVQYKWKHGGGGKVKYT